MGLVLIRGASKIKGRLNIMNSLPMFWVKLWNQFFTSTIPEMAWGSFWAIF